MRIAQVAPLAEPVPPPAYGGTERVVSWLTEELVRRGHEVTLFASGDSRTSANLVSTTPVGLRMSGKLADYSLHLMLQLEQVAERCRQFDVIHYHCDYHHFPLSRRCGVPQLTTLHGRLDLPGLPLVFGEFPEMPLVSISHAQRKPVSGGNWVSTIHHGLPKESFHYRPEPGKYLAFLGRICPEKRLDRAIRIAEAVRLPLRVAAKVDPMDERYFQEEMRPLLDNPWIEFIGEIGDHDKAEFLGNAKALLFPIDWPEPFGLVMIEALACGTPVLAFNHGSVPEVLRHGSTAFIVDDMDEAIDCTRRIDQLDRASCRADFEQRFSVESMVDNYEDAYLKVIANKHAALSRRGQVDVSPSWTAA